MFRLTFSPVFDSFFLVVVLVVVMILIVGLLPPKRQDLTRRRRNILLLLRTLAIFFLCFALFRPAIVYQKGESLPATLVLLLDCTESMSIPDETGGQTRYEAMKSALDKVKNSLAQLEKKHEIQVFAFDRQIEPLKIEQGKIALLEHPEGRETAIGFSLQQVLEQNAGKRLLGTILFSDGTQRTRPPYDLLPQTAAMRFRDSGDAIYTVRLGNAAGQNTREEIVIQDLIVNDRVFIKNELVVSGQLRVRGFANQKIPIGLYFETAPNVMSEVGRQEIVVSGSEELIPYQFRYVPQTPGQWKLTVALIPPPGVPLQPNQSQSRFVRVLDHGVNVFHIEGTWRPEAKFLRMAIDASPDIQLKFLHHAGSRESLMPYFKPGEFAAYILGDIDSTAFQPEELAALAEAVKQGAGLLMLGGTRTFGAGGYFDTPLADVSPIIMNPLDRQPLQGPITNPGISESVRMVPSQLGRGHYLMRLTPNLDDNEKLWRSLPPLVDANLFGRLKPLASVLAETPNGEPLLVTQVFGSGRVMAFAGSSTWRWWALGHSRELKRFWRQAILWLAKMDESLDGDCWIEMEKTRFSPGDVVMFRIHVQAKTGEEIMSPKATVTVTTPEKRSEPVILIDEDGILTGSFRATEHPGDYTIRATVEIPGKDPAESEIKEASGRFMVVDQNLELEDPIASPTVLENIATTTGGISIAPENLPLLLDKLTKRSENLIEYHETKQTLYDTWFFFLMLTALLVSEWFLRKRWGLT